MFDVWFAGRLLVATHSAYKELEELAMDLNDVRGVLEQGFDCSSGKRRKGTLERCLHTGGRITRVVAVMDYNYFLQQDCLTIIHASRQAATHKLLKRESDSP